METILSYLNSAAAIVVVLGLCLLCHEAGHFALAKLFNMKVEEFAFGFGRALVSGRRGETLYRLNLLPFGGYVKIVGMEPGAENVERGFHSRPRWQGALVIAAGSTANVLLAFVLFAVVTAWQGVPDLTDSGIYIAKVNAGTPAAQAGLETGDRIVAVDGQRHSLELQAVRPGLAQANGLRDRMMILQVGEQEVYTPAEMLMALRSTRSPAQVIAFDYNATRVADQIKITSLPVPQPLRGETSAPAVQALQQAYSLQFGEMNQTALVGYIAMRPRQEVVLTVERDGQMLDLPATTLSAHGRVPAWDKTGKQSTPIREIGRIGVVLRGATRPAGLVESIQIGALRMVESVASVVLILQAMLQRHVSAELSGLVGIMVMTSERARIGWDAVIAWTGMISSMLAVINLFPFPPFDGFRIVLLGFEAIIRRRVDARLETIISIAGLILVLLLFVALLFKDIVNYILYGIS